MPVHCYTLEKKNIAVRREKAASALRHSAFRAIIAVMQRFSLVEGDRPDGRA